MDDSDALARGGKIAAIDALADPERLAQLDLALHPDS